MKGFDALELEWDGETYAVPATSQMELILRVETGLIAGRKTQALTVLRTPGGPPLALFSKVFADALIYAGANVTHLEVYKELTKDAMSNGVLFVQAFNQVLKILGLLAPEGDEEPKAKGRSAKKTKSAGA